MALKSGFRSGAATDGSLAEQFVAKLQRLDQRINLLGVLYRPNDARQVAVTPRCVISGCAQWWPARTGNALSVDNGRHIVGMRTAIQVECEYRTLFLLTCHRLAAS